MVKVAVLYYSSTGTNQQMALAVEEGAKGAGAETRVRMFAETAPEAAIAQNAAWKAFHDKHKNDQKASLDDLEWADAVVIGTPTRFGSPASQVRAFIDTTGGLWFQGKLANKVYSGFTSAINAHGGQESTLLALYNTFYHWGGVIVTPGYTDQSVFTAGGNPYGPSVVTGMDGKGLKPENLAHARYLGKRVAEMAKKIKG